VSECNVIVKKERYLKGIWRCETNW